MAASGARGAACRHFPRIGFLGLAGEFSRVEALRVGLRDLGHIEGANVVIEWRWAEKVDQLPELAGELVRMNVNVIVAPSSTFVEAAAQVTTTIPIVFAVHADPVGLGHVASLARPGGNITGLSMLLTGAAPPGTGDDEGSHTEREADRVPVESHDALSPSRPEGNRDWRRKV